MMRHASFAPTLFFAVLGGLGCSRGESPPPREEFLVAAGDSTYWVQSSRSGIRVRGAPITLARIGGRFHEVYVADDDRSFEQAVFVSPRLFRRDLLTGDSTLVWQDTTFDALVADYERKNPADRRLEPDEDAPDEPRSSNSSELGLIELHGPYLSFEYHRDVDTDDTPAWHATRRGVVDLRTGSQVSIAKLFGDTTEHRVVRLGRRAYLSMLDSVMSAKGEGARRAAQALGDFHFDPLSYALADVEGSPAIAFHAPGRGDGTSGGVTLPLPAIEVSESGWWRRDVRPELPDIDEQAGRERWANGANVVEARYDTASDAAQLVLVGRGGREWSLARVGTPVYRIHWIGRTTLDSVGRNRLARAFAEAASYDENVRLVSHPPRATRRLARNARTRHPVTAASRRIAPTKRS
jgi:hypothetical protein